MLSIRYSPAVTIAATAACSAQNPVPQAVSMHTPRNRRPPVVVNAAATSPNNRPPDRYGLSTVSAARINPWYDMSANLPLQPGLEARTAAMAVCSTGEHRPHAGLAPGVPGPAGGHPAVAAPARAGGDGGGGLVGGDRRTR